MRERHAMPNKFIVYLKRVPRIVFSSKWFYHFSLEIKFQLQVMFHLVVFATIFSVSRNWEQFSLQLLLRCYNSAFMSCIQRLESDRQCQGLDMRSFLMLPMQRVTRYPLLVIAILDRIPTESEQHKTAQMALHFANHVSQLSVIVENYKHWVILNDF